MPDGIQFDDSKDPGPQGGSTQCDQTVTLCSFHYPFTGLPAPWLHWSHGDLARRQVWAQPQKHQMQQSAGLDHLAVTQLCILHYILATTSPISKQLTTVSPMGATHELMSLDEHHYVVADSIQRTVSCRMVLQFCMIKPSMIHQQLRQPTQGWRIFASLLNRAQRPGGKRRKCRSQKLQTWSIWNEAS